MQLLKKTNPLHVNTYQNLTLGKSSNEWYTIGMDWNILVLQLIACIPKHLLISVVQLNQGGYTKPQCPQNISSPFHLEKIQSMDNNLINVPNITIVVILGGEFLHFLDL
jgi:hypothetical protein